MGCIWHGFCISANAMVYLPGYICQCTHLLADYPLYSTHTKCALGAGTRYSADNKHY